MIYRERKPRPPLDRCIQKLWYVRAPGIDRRRERVLPNGCVQVILNLERDFLVDCSENGPDCHMAPSLVVGARVKYELIDRSDMADLIGIIFRPGGFACFADDPVDAFSHCSTSLENVWPRQARSLRDRLGDLATPEARLDCLERFLMTSYADRLGTNPIIDFALRRFAQLPSVTGVERVARETGWSTRHFSQIFREHVGVSPKAWCRIQRFQSALRHLRSGSQMPWAELALDCGYYDQSHFSNEFRAFSGINPSTYSARQTQWVNHIRVD
jgi:AraC-like DNA-binding protein